ncbi:MAG: nitroreductase [Hydrogenophaga sp.]|uniref:nitroreductase family protein n=1 Tax=Hydrogenophaga sp. TaxID=1904254 RepID=UPI001BB8A77D|nr:nitroreductase [Hydrogenophaga sp.]MBS3910958.1 nitroreductase [Hydrogenophaga sp.]MDO9149472.1 nitroreductase [Hydrogenophaga sp.]MDO9606839.1 nitroreductase [Hydrogenophaga sp.]MDP2166313.1 nitroreductase [Hydrogenophaga sp.]MDP3475805.1 nitroreductase [Hydrogenophaga sp.]
MFITECNFPALEQPANDWPAVAGELIQARQTVLPKRLIGPGPDAAQQHTILAAAAAAPDHGQLLPWRFIAVPDAQRERLAEVFGQALLERDAGATPEQVAQAREKAHRAPWLMLVVVDGLRGDPAVDLAERMLSAGCAVQNALLMATALGFGSALTSGKALKSTSLRTLFGLHDGEHALCFVSVGTVRARKPARVRPAVAEFLSTLGDPPAPR